MEATRQVRSPRQASRLQEAEWASHGGWWLLLPLEGCVSLAAAEGVALRLLEVFAHHLGDQLAEGDFWLPAKLFARFRRVAEQGFDFGGAE